MYPFNKTETKKDSANGNPAVQKTLITDSPGQKRIGSAKGKFTIPEDFDSWDNETEEMFDDHN
jgi:hypothetical protein